MKAQPLPIHRSRCAICGGTTKQTVHPHNADLYKPAHSYPYDDEDATHQAAPTTNP